MDKLEEQIGALREEEAKYTQESGEDVNQHQQLLNDLAQKLQSTEATAEKYELKYQDAQKTINSLKVGREIRTRVPAVTGPLCGCPCVPNVVHCGHVKRAFL